MPPVFNRIDIKDYCVLKIENQRRPIVHLRLNENVRITCNRCESDCIWKNGRYLRKARHLTVFGRESTLIIHTHRYRCRACGKRFISALPGLLPGRHSTEPFREKIARDHHEGICVSSLARLAGVSEASVERFCAASTQRKAAERESLDRSRLKLEAIIFHGLVTDFPRDLFQRLNG